MRVGNNVGRIENHFRPIADGSRQTAAGKEQLHTEKNNSVRNNVYEKVK